MRRNLALCAVYLAFAMPVAMLGVAWPEIRDLLARSEGELGVLAGCYGMGRLAMAASSGVVLRGLAFGWAIVVAALALAVSSSAVAAAPAWPALVVAVTVVGLASGALESLGSRFLAVSGSVRTAGLVAGSYGIGATIGPVLVAWSGRWQMAYGISAVVTVAAGALFATPAQRGLVGADARDRASVAAPAPLEAANCDDPEGGRGEFPEGGGRGVPGGGRGDVPAGVAMASRGAVAGSLDRVAVVMSLGLFVAFSGIEVTAGQWTATLLEQGRGLDRQAAGLAVSGFWGGITIGRLAMGAVDLPMRVVRLLAVALIPIFAVVAAGPVWAAPVAVALAGVALAPMFPALMATTGSRVGTAHAGQVSGWQLLAGNTGATAVPAVTGLVVAWTSPAAPSAVLIGLAVVGAVLLGVTRAYADPR